MGAHILHDHRLYGRMSPCGFCLNSQCEVHLICHGQMVTIDMQKSHCPNLRKIRLKIAESFSERQPCTNHPLKCPLCPLIVWKYNLKSHITDGHPTANVALYETLYKLHPSESMLMKGVFLAPTHSTKNKQSKIKALAISAAHISHMVLRYDFLSVILNYRLFFGCRMSEDPEDEDNYDGQEEEGIVNPQDDEVSSGESEPMEDTAADEHAVREDLDYGVEGVGKPTSLETNTSDDHLHSVPVAP